MTQNSPDLWISKLPRPVESDHKYKRGHAVIYGAPELTGATRLAAEACARVGAGLVSVLATPDVAAIYRASLPAHIMVRDDISWHDPRITARLYGPGGLPCTVDYEDAVPTILDASALRDLPARLSGDFVLTPHEGEFSALFPDLGGEREENVRQAVKKSGATIILKGAQTIIAAPDGRMVVNDHASPYLATAGSGDVLAGMITGLVAAGMEGFDAACAATWIHGEAAIGFGPGLVASDLPVLIPSVLAGLLNQK